MTYLLCKEFGWTPEDVENMSAEWFSLFTEFMRQEAKAGRLKQQQGNFYR